jgi:hypothetical protein
MVYDAMTLYPWRINFSFLQVIDLSSVSGSEGLCCNRAKFSCPGSNIIGFHTHVGGFYWYPSYSCSDSSYPILGLQSAQFSKEDVSAVVHPSSPMIGLDSDSLFESVSEPTNANSHFLLTARDSFSDTMVSSIPSRSISLRENSDSSS